MSEFKSIKWKVDLPYVVRLLKDEPEEKKGKYGMFQEYTVEYEGEEYKFIASEGLHSSLLEYKKGDLLEIMKNQGEGDKTYFTVEALSEEDIKTTDSTKPELQKMPEQPPVEYEKSEKDWDKINATKDHKILIQVALKKAVDSFPPKAKFTDKDYDEIEVRTVKFNAMMEKYIGVVMKEPKKKFSPLVQTKWDEFDKYLIENIFKIESYSKVRAWLDNLKDPTTKVLTEQLAKLKDTLQPKKSGSYESYHESLITACCETLKTKDRVPVIQTLTNMFKKWDIKGLEKLSETSENQCLNLLEEFDKRLKADDESDVPF